MSEKFVKVKYRVQQIGCLGNNARSCERAGRIIYSRAVRLQDARSEACMVLPTCTKCGIRGQIGSYEVQPCTEFDEVPISATIYAYYPTYDPSI